MDTDIFEVRVNRLILFCFALIGGLFLLAGLDMLVFGKVLDFDLSLWGAVAVLVFFVGTGGAILANCALYLLKPPVMLRFSPQGVSFGTGFRYRHGEPFPWRLLQGAALSVDANSATSLKQLMAGPQLTFAQDPAIPQSLATSAGLSYAFSMLTLNALFMNRLPRTVLRQAERFKKSYS